MTPEELKIIIGSTGWSPLGNGTYNEVLVSQKDITIEGYTGKWVFKVPNGCYISESARAVRKWNKLNPDYPAFKAKTGWVAPYLGNTPASDRQISEKLIDIYRKTREIIADAGARRGNNFLLHQGEVVCIDVDHAFRRNSIATRRLDAANDTNYDGFLSRCAVWLPLTITVIKALFYLEKNLSDNDIQDKYITASIIEKLPVFWHEKKTINVRIMDTLSEITGVDPTGKIRNKHLTPEFVETLGKQQTTVTKELLASLVMNRLLTRAQPDGILDPDDVKSLISYHPALLNQVDEQGFTLLHLASRSGHTAIVNYLLEEGLSLDTLTLTIPNSINSHKTALDLAIREGKDSVAKLLLNRGAIISPDVYNSFKYLAFVARSGSLEAVKSFIEHNPQAIHATDHSNQTALLWAAAGGRNDVMEWLITQGANVNIATQLPDDHPLYLAQHNQSPMDCAIEGGHGAVIFTLIKAGAIANRVHSKVKGKTLGTLIKNGDIDSVKILLTHNKTLLNQIDQYGYSPLHYGACFGCIDIVRYLIDSRVDLNVVTPAAVGQYKNINYPEMTALEILLSIQQHESILLLLLDAGAILSPTAHCFAHALNIAAKNKCIDLVKKLIGLDPARMKAEEDGFTNLLERAGKNESIEKKLISNSIFQPTVIHEVTINQNDSCPAASSSFNQK